MLLSSLWVGALGGPGLPDAMKVTRGIYTVSASFPPNVGLTPSQPVFPRQIRAKRCNCQDRAYAGAVSRDREKWPQGRPRLFVVQGQSGPLRRVPKRTWSPLIPVAAVATHFALRWPLDSWLNASSDSKFISALVVVSAPLLFAGYAFYRWVWPKPRH